MLRRFRGRPSAPLVVSLVALAVAVSGAAVAAIPGSDGRIQACYSASGHLRVVETADACSPIETPLSWNQAGPKGDPGPPGGSTLHHASDAGEISFDPASAFFAAGPRVAVDVPPNALTAVTVAFEGRTEGTGCPELQVQVYEATDGVRLFAWTYGAEWRRLERASTALPATAGPREYVVRFGNSDTSGSDCTAFVRDVRLWVEVKRVTG